MKKSISVFLSFCLVLSMLLTGLVTASAEGNVIEGTNITWNFNAETGELHFEGAGAIPDFDSYKNDSGDVDLQYPWKDIDYTSIVFGEGITGIGNYAFCYSDKLTSVVIPDTVTVLGKGIFYCCYNLKSVTMPSEVTAIGDSMFSACESLETVTFGAKTETIGKEAFYKCASLSEITLPATLKSIDEAAFSTCTSLKSIELPEGFTALGSRVFYNCEELETVSLPTTLETVGENAFEGCRLLTEIVFPDAIASLPAYVCGSCLALESVTLPANLTEIGAGAFNVCPALKEITIPASVTAIGEKALGYGRRGSKVSGFTINGYANSEAVVRYAESNGFGLNSVGYITSGSCSENITWEYNEEEKTLYIKGSGEMPDYTSESFVAYNYIPYEKIVIDPEITKIGSYAFYGAGAVDFALYEKVTAIGEKAIGYYSENGKPTLREGVSITGYDGSAAMTYAAENDITFNSLGMFIITEGTLGEAITWTYDKETKVLNVSGTGATYDYAPGNLPGFAEYDIQSIVVSDGITILGDYVFCTTIAYSDITFGKDISEVHTNAFGFIKTEKFDEEGNPTGVTAYVPNDILVVRGYISTPVDDYAKYCEFTFEPLDGNVLPLFSLIVPSVIDHVRNFIIIYQNEPDAEAIKTAFPVENFTEVIFPEVFGSGSVLTLVNENGTYTYKLVVKGDGNGDGAINSSDALVILQHSVETNVFVDDAVLTATDLNNDGEINSSDALAVLQISVGSRDVYEGYHPGIIR